MSGQTQAVSWHKQDVGSEQRTAETETHIDGIRGLISDMFVPRLAVGTYNDEVVGE